jgi:hypothetical protein
MRASYLQQISFFFKVESHSLLILSSPGQQWLWWLKDTSNWPIPRLPHYNLCTSILPVSRGKLYPRAIFDSSFSHILLSKSMQNLTTWFLTMYVDWSHPDSSYHLQYCNNFLTSLSSSIFCWFYVLKSVYNQCTTWCV